MTQYDSQTGAARAPLAAACMKHVMPIALITLLSLLCLITPGCRKSGQSASDGAAPVRINPEPVVLYCSVDQEYGEQVIQAFHKLHPNIKVAVRYDTEATKTTGLIERLRTEQNAPQADIFWSSEIFLTQKLASEGILRPWVSDTTQLWPDNLRGSERRWYAFAGRARVIAYSKSRVKIPPESWKDLADPRYKNRVVMGDPNFGTTRGAVAAWFAVWGKEDATEYLQALRSNGLRIVQSNSQAARQVVQGLADLAMCDSDDVWAQIRNGDQDMGLVYPRHGDGPGMGTLIVPNSLGMLTHRANRPEANLLADFILSQQTEQILYDSDSHNIPLRYADEIKIKPKYIVPDPLKVNYGSIVQSMPEANEAVNRILYAPGN